MNRCIRAVVNHLSAILRYGLRQHIAEAFGIARVHGKNQILQYIQRGIHLLIKCL